MVDAELGRLQGVEPPCSPGCFACCCYEVEATRDEALLLASHVLAGHPVDAGRLAEQGRRERNSPLWLRPAAPDNRCVFLDAEGRCGVYDDRPSACRKLLVASPPEECGRPGGIPRPITIPLAELAISAALSLPGCGLSSLPTGLAQALVDSRSAS
jgi:hypothetical protein